MSEDKQYEVAVIGAGPGGYVAAIRAAQLGLKTALIEKQGRLGGTCLNVGCIPSKALLSSTELLMDIREIAPLHGISLGSSKKSPSIDLEVMMERKERIVEKLTSGVASLMKQNQVDVLTGEAAVPEAGRVEITPTETSANGEIKQTISAKNIVLATGSLPVELPFLPFNGASLIDSTDALSLQEIPKELVVIGAGAIGLEMGSVWSRLGAKVTIVELMETVLPGWDRQVGTEMKRVLKKQGITIELSVKITEYKESKGKITLLGTNKKGGKAEYTGDKVLVSAGRKPYVPDGIVKSLGLSLDDRGRVRVNERFETNCSGVYAVGDCTPGTMLAHKAEEEGTAVAEIIAGRKSPVNYEAVPSVVYTAPEVASVGKTEEECKNGEIPYNKGIFRFGANGKALAEEKTEGFVKVLSRKDNDKLLGVHIIGNQAGTLIQEAVTVIEFEGSAEDIGRTVHAHPTLSEAVKEAGLGAFEKPIHGF